ncbi:MAG: 4-carboxymuconolactone decarboxylase [Oceanicoccus sp.]|jgi:4-carboxymuconolactone decarboxylase
MSNKVRLQPLADKDMSEELLEMTKHYRRGGILPNVFRIALRHTKLFKAYKPFSLFTQALSNVEPRVRELAILRVAWNNQSEYEWVHHVRIALQETNLREADFDNIKIGTEAPNWGELDKMVLSLVDQMRATSNVDDETYEYLMTSLGEHKFTELLHTIGNYDMIAKVLNIFGVPLEEGLEAFETNIQK